MADVYRHHPGPDEHVGRVEADGRVYGHRAGPDRYLGRVTGDGRIDLHVPAGPDVHAGRVEPGGRVYARRPGPALDRYLGRVEGAPLLQAGGAAFFLLLSGRVQEE
jgi:hypothetical protein